MRLVKINYSIWWTQDERKTNGRSYTSNEHLHKIKGRQFLVTIFEHLDYSKPLPHIPLHVTYKQIAKIVIGVIRHLSHTTQAQKELKVSLKYIEMGHQKSGRLGMTCFSTTQTCLNLADRSLGRRSSIGSRKGPSQSIVTHKGQ